MKGPLDHADISLTCPNCRHEFQKSVGWLKKNNNFTCGGCDTLFKAEDFADAIAEVEKPIKDFLKSFK